MRTLRNCIECPSEMPHRGMHPLDSHLSLTPLCLQSKPSEELSKLLGWMAEWVGITLGTPGVRVRNRKLHVSLLKSLHETIASFYCAGADGVHLSTPLLQRQCWHRHSQTRALSGEFKPFQVRSSAPKDGAHWLCFRLLILSYKVPGGTA